MRLPKTRVTPQRLVIGWLLLVGLCGTALAQARPILRIDRKALVQRHNPHLTQIDPTSPLMVGNGNLALSADLTGLATFQDQYSPRVPLMIQAQWAWHSFPNPKKFHYSQSLVPLEVDGRQQSFPWLRNWEEAKQPHIAWLRENPHRYSLGRLSLHLVQRNGRTAQFSNLSNTNQTLDLWSGRLQSRFELEGEKVHVETSVHPDRDIVVLQLESPLLNTGRLGVNLRFPGVSADLNPNPADWQHPNSHKTIEVSRTDRGIVLNRQLDQATYSVVSKANRSVQLISTGPHAYRILAPGQDSVTLLVLFSKQPQYKPLPTASAARADVADHWQEHWQNGGVVDFSGCSDPRAHELERRVVLSQYLMAVNAAGRLPPQEEGLFSNSWNGKFHLEMHLWHAGHFALWGRPELLERSMSWYLRHLPTAKNRARSHGVRGAWWPKMVGPEGRESPSTINPFIMWQQPHPIFLAELLYRAHPTWATLQRYEALVHETAELLGSYPRLNPMTKRRDLGPPIVPAQEVFTPRETHNPTFELAYFRQGLETAQLWRARLGYKRNAHWDRVMAELSPLPEKHNLYLATESHPKLWTQARSLQCSSGRTEEKCLNRDHPSFLGAFGLLRGTGVNPATMHRTLKAVMDSWDHRQTWGWDSPLMAMTAARLGLPQQAVNFLLSGSKNFRFGPTGMTPRVHLQPSSPLGGSQFRRAAETYFPSNGGLLLAIAMMVAGWDGASTTHPGFPNDGSWVVRSEGLLPLP